MPEPAPAEAEGQVIREGSPAMVLFNASKGTVLADQVTFAGSFGRRLRGWMGRASVGRGEALVLMPCRSVHTWFMRFPIDVLFLAPDGEVVLTLPEIRPFCFGPYVPRAAMAVELPSGRLAESRTAVGDRLVFRNEEER
ncbi:MAG: DUF192 domain-containing protein [Moorellales bacterium]